MDTKPKTVADYIAQAPDELQEKLKTLQETIKETVPEAEEKLSYGMPYYGYKGRLVYFAYAKHHIGIYLPPPVVDDHKEDLKKYVTSTSAVQFPHDEDLPLPLIKKLVLARKKINEEKEKK